MRFVGVSLWIIKVPLGKLRLPHDFDQVKGRMMSRILYLILHFALNEFVSGCIGKKNIPVNQIVTKRTAHPPSFETCQMCGSVYKLLIFKRLKK